MAKASGTSKGIIGAINAAGLRAALGLATGKAQKDNQSMLSAMIERLGHMVPFLGDALSRDKGSKHAMLNLMEVAKTMETIITRHQQTRSSLQRAAKERLEFKTPAPNEPTIGTPKNTPAKQLINEAAPKPRRVSAQNTHLIMQPTPKGPSFTDN